MKIFTNKNYNVHGRVLPLDKFKLMRDTPDATVIKEKLGSILELAESDLEKDIPMLTLSMYRSYLEKGSTVTYGNPYCERMNMALRLLVAELVYDNGKYVDKLADVLWAILDEATWVLPEHTVHTPNEKTRGSKVPGAVGDLYPHGLELGVCYRGATVALVHHYMKTKLDEISPLISERIVYEIKERVINPFLNYKFWWSGVAGNKVNNWCPWNVSNILLCLALVEEDMEKREKAVSLALEFLDNFIGWYGEDGGCDEGPTYWNAAAGCLFDSLEILADLTDGYINIFDEPLIRAMGEYEARANITDMYFVNFADSHSTVRLDGNMLRRYGEKCLSPIITALGNRMLTFSDTCFDTKLPYRTLRSITTPKPSLDGFVSEAATDTYLSNLKIMILRDSTNPDEGMFFAMKGGHNNESHNHNDVGSFIVYNNGKPVLIDAGVGTYTKQTFSKDRYKIWSMQSLYHNLPSFDGLGQLAGEKYASKNEVYDEKARKLSLDITDAYSEDAGVRSYVRTGSLNNGVVTLTDKILLDKESLADFVFLTHRMPKMISEGKISLTEGCVLGFDPALEASIEEFDPIGMDTLKAWGNEKLYRIHLVAKCKDCSLTFTVSNK